ncbi:MAG: ABC transporter permease [Phycisphaeraceae bacterium]|nr:ABC transporter permease [Phycisphaeraceae bacterium]
MSLLRTPFYLARFLLQSILLALGQIWMNKTRSVLTTTGIVIGVAAVTAVIAALTGLRSNILGEFEALGTNKLYIIPYRPDTGRFQHASGRTLRFTPDQFDGLVEHCPSVAGFTLLADAADKVIRGDRSIDGARITGIQPAWHEIENRTVTLGRPFSLLDEQRAAYVCLINPETRDQLRLDRDCNGQSIYIGNRRFLIVGVVEPAVQSALFLNQGEGAEVFVPFRTHWNVWQSRLIAIAASQSPDVSDDARAEVRFFLRQTRELKPDDPDTFRIEVIEQYLRQFDRVAATITMVAGAIVGVSLLVGGVGIMNIMLVSVSERTREIGLRKAVGARPAAILFQFLIEAVTLCSLGGLLGIAGGWALTLLMAVLPGAQLDKAYIPLWAIAVAFGFSALVGVFFGMFPAFKAAGLDPIEALRHE